MTPIVGFSTFLVATVAALGLVVWTGMTARRSLHLACVLATGVGLALAIVYALRVGELYDLEAAGPVTPFHLGLAKVTTAAFLLPIATGVMTWRDARWKRLHARLAWIVIAMTVVTTITGLFMLLGAEPIA